MAISKVILNSDVQMDVTDTTASQSDVASTKYYYGADGVKKQGSYVVPSAVTQATPTISVNSSTGLITASSTQSAGVVSAGTKSATEQLSTENGKTVTPTTSEQTAVAANKYTLGAIKVAAMPAGSAGTPTATKGTVSNHSVSVTPSVTNTTGYITGSTKTGTAVSISASELVSGTKSISANGTSDVTNYASVDVSVPTGTARDGDDVSVSGATVTVPAGLYSSQVSKTVASGSAATPATSITANPSISVSSGGLITATTSATKSVTPTVSAGYVSSGTAGTITVNGSNTEQLSTQAAQTLYPSTSDQTISSGKYLTGTQTFKGVLLTNLTAGNIKKNVVVKVGDSIDDDRITSVTGTYEGGGGGGSITGLVYESGTWTPSEDVVDYTISFTDTHTTAPFYYVITDDSATYSSTTNSNFVCMFFSPYLFCGAINMGANSSTGGFYAYTWHRYRATDVNTLSSATNTSFTVESNISNWATSTGIRAYCTNGTRYWRTARTYKWVAVWASET